MAYDGAILIAEFLRTARTFDVLNFKRPGGYEGE